LLFAALLTRTLIPVGFMPGPGGIILCSGYGPVPVMDMPGMDMSGSPPQRHDGTEFCPYTAVASVMAAGQAAPLAAFTLFVPSIIVFPPEKSLPRGTIVPTSLPRGPPPTA
jgi:hypothetical protein